MADARDRMMNELRAGSDGAASGDASAKTLIIRGCDPVMAARASQMFPPMLGNVQLIACTDDQTFFAKLEERKYDVCLFAPGACRHSAAGNPIPGGNSSTTGWSLKEYKEAVKQIQGTDVVIVETVAEKEVVPLLRAALSLPAA
eukprot:TRINITY_DN39464_c1_g1_i1.p1 TRINITY_DN39464_c1_g1~~TRINITY_DN39464_c1_g1_i1.p1  ORF type:complete len:144 (+),score=34.84 TRINITY_DN39464_c1_g1_i1:38-469(+)